MIFVRLLLYNCFLYFVIKNKSLSGGEFSVEDSTSMYWVKERKQLLETKGKISQTEQSVHEKEKKKKLKTRLNSQFADLVLVQGTLPGQISADAFSIFQAF